MSMLLTDDSPVCASAPVRPPRPPIEMRQADPAGRLPRPPDGRWLAVLPPARQVLAVGEEAALLAPWHRQQHAQARWQAMPLPMGGEALAPALPPAGSIDLLLLSPGFFALTDADRWLARLGECCAPGARLSLALDNGCTLERMARLLEAGTAAAGDPQHDPARAHAPATVYKLLLDAGWLPHLAAHEPVETADPAFAQGVRQLASLLGLGEGCVDEVHRMRRLHVLARRDDAGRAAAALPPRASAPFAVVVPTTDEAQLRANVLASPGLREVNARIAVCRGATSPGDAIAQAEAACEADWLLLCHQDVYFPPGFGQRLAAELEAIPAHERPRTLLGFIGVGVDAQGQRLMRAGQVIDRLIHMDHPGSGVALSFDEVAIVVSRGSIHRIAPEMGWHLWATDLCLTAISQHRVMPRLLSLPLFHNSRTGWGLPEAFVDSAERLIARHPAFAPIHTLCATLTPEFVASRRALRR